MAACRKHFSLKGYPPLYSQNNGTSIKTYFEWTETKSAFDWKAARHSMVGHQDQHLKFIYTATRKLIKEALQAEAIYNEM